MKKSKTYLEPTVMLLNAFVEQGFAYSAGVEDPTKPDEQTDW